MFKLMPTYITVAPNYNYHRLCILINENEGLDDFV